MDYDSFVGFTLTLTSGQSAGDVQCTDLIVTVDSMVETSETLTIHLATQDVDVILIEPNVATITIIDDDGKYNISLAVWKLKLLSHIKGTHSHTHNNLTVSGGCA